MASRRRTKKSRLRGSHTHGWGSKKKHRGSGNRGGAGQAGTGKRAQSKKPRIWGTRYFGKFERVSLNRKKIAINVGDLESFAVDKQIKLENGKYNVDLGHFGVSRLIGKGFVEKIFAVKVPHASPSAKEKIVKAGGTVSTQEVSE